MSSWQMLCTKEGHVSMYVAYPLHVSRNFLLILSHPYLWIFVDRDPGAPHSHNNNRQKNTHGVSIFHTIIHHHPKIPALGFTYPLGTPAGMAASPPASPPASKSTSFSARLEVIICLHTSHSSLPVAMAYLGAMNLPEPNLSGTTKQQSIERK
jgi:hypothetical protein